MWFKNLRLYRLTNTLALTPEQLGIKLLATAFQPCPRMQESSFGWAPPLGRYGSELIHVVNGVILLCARREQKILPAGVIRALAQEKIEALQDERQRKASKRERQMIRDDIMQELLPRALSRQSQLLACIFPQQNLLIVDSSSRTQAEELLALLRQSLGSLSVVPVAVQQSPAAIMTRWLEQQAVPPGFALGQECVLRDKAEQAAVVRCRNMELTSSEIEAHLQAGKQVTSLALQWAESFSFVLEDDLAIKRLRFTDIVKEQAAAFETEEMAARLDNDFAIMSLELARFVPVLLEQLGGEESASDLAKAEQAA